jgi:hypothetical protein
MELIQNADDNEYDPSAQPVLVFYLETDHLLVANNERGFEEPNVRALCSLGKSTKARKQGYIGEKGIGFKSVFVWSDEPHILSNGFDFKFKHGNVTAPGELGFLVPYAPCRHEWPAESVSYVSHGLGISPPPKTLFFLPFRERGDNSRATAAVDLSKQFQSDMQPETVLFLRKVRRLPSVLRRCQSERRRARHDSQLVALTRVRVRSIALRSSPRSSLVGPTALDGASTSATRSQTLIEPHQPWSHLLMLTISGPRSLSGSARHTPTASTSRWRGR